MTFDISAALKPEHQQKQFCNPTSANKSRIFLRIAAWCGFWLAIVLALYWSVLPSLPYRDHPYLMLNHQLAENDWQWFWSMLSYNRTNVLRPGDYFSFRPLQMAIVALQDIFLHYNLVAQGVVNCLQFAFAAAVFCSLARRFVSTFAALALTFLWVSQPVGSSLVMWQHITPYILCPAFLMASLRILDGDDLDWPLRTKEVVATICVFAATLTNDIGVATALSVSVLAMLFGGRNVVRRRQILMVFLLPMFATCVLNLTDYFIIHPTPSFLYEPFTEQSSLTLINQFMLFAGAIGSAFFVSPALQLEHSSGGYTIWKFYNESPLLLTSMAVLVSALLLTSCIVAVRELRKNGISRRSLFLSLLLSFFLATFTVCAFRIYARNIDYMAEATYYYSLFSLTLSGMAVCLLNAAKRTVINSIAIVILIAGAFNISISNANFSKSENDRNVFQSAITEVRTILTQTPSLCFCGVIPFSLSYGPLLQDVSCANRPGATPLYINSNKNNEVWLSSVLYNSNNFRMIPTTTPPTFKLPENGVWVISQELPYGHDMQFTANKVGNITIALTDQTGIQKSITIQRNLLKRSIQNAGESAPVTVEAALDRDSAASMITYKLGFTQDRIALFADGRLIGALPASPPETTSLIMVLRSTDKIKADIGNMSISEQPSQGHLQVNHRFNLVKQ